MRRVLSLAFLALLFCGPASAQMMHGIVGSGSAAGGGGGGSYVGPCDTAVAGGGGCTLYYGLRAATNANAAALASLFDWTCSNGGPQTGTVHATSAGDANATELTAMSATCSSATVFVTKIYEQIAGTAHANAVSTGLEFYNAGASCQTLPRCFYVNTDINVVTAAVGISQPWSMATVSCRTGSFTANGWIAAKSGSWAAGFGSSADQAALYAGSLVTATATDCNGASNPHATQYVADGASSKIVVDNSASTVNAGTNSLTDDFGVGADDTGGSKSNAVISEIAVYPIALAAGSSAGQYGKVCNNQRVYWGTGGAC